MGFDVETVVQALEDEGVRLDRGLTEADLRRIEKKFGFTFAPDHRALLRVALPSGDAWLNWRHATPAKIRERLQVPVDAAARIGQPAPGRTGSGVVAVPVLVPLYGACYVPAEPAGAGSPVFEVTPDRVRLRGADLLEFVRAEFGTPGAGAPPVAASPALGQAGFWWDLAVRGGTG
jgi:hypothetical protein